MFDPFEGEGSDLSAMANGSVNNEINTFCTRAAIMTARSKMALAHQPQPFRNAYFLNHELAEARGLADLR